MKNINFKATFTNSEKIIEFDLTRIIYNMGNQCAEEVSPEEEIGEELAYLQDNWENVILEIID